MEGVERKNEPASISAFAIHLFAKVRDGRKVGGRIETHFPNSESNKREKNGHDICAIKEGMRCSHEYPEMYFFLEVGHGYAQLVCMDETPQYVIDSRLNR